MKLKKSLIVKASILIVCGFLLFSTVSCSLFGKKVSGTITVKKLQ